MSVSKSGKILRKSKNPIPNQEGIPVEVCDDEELDRIIFSPSMVTDGIVSYSAFTLIVLNSGQNESYLSVFRALYWNRLPSGVTFPPRKKEDTLYGYATLFASDYRNAKIENIYCTVKQWGRKRYHAGVQYFNGGMTIKGECDDPDFIDLLMDFADSCRLTRFPA